MARCEIPSAAAAVPTTSHGLVQVERLANGEILLLNANSVDDAGHTGYGTSMGLARRTMKVTVSLPVERVREAKRAVAEGRAPSLSSYVASALERREEGDSLAAIVAEMIGEAGEPSEPARRWARKALGLEE